MRSLEDITFFHLWKVFRRKYLIIAGVTVGVAVAVWLFCSFFIAPTYRATVALYAWDGYNRAIEDTKNESLIGTRDLAFAD